MWSWLGKLIKQKAGRKADYNIKAKGRRGMCNCSDHIRPDLRGEKMYKPYRNPTT